MVQMACHTLAQSAFKNLPKRCLCWQPACSSVGCEGSVMLPGNNWDGAVPGQAQQPWEQRSPRPCAPHGMVRSDIPAHHPLRHCTLPSCLADGIKISTRLLQLYSAPFWVWAQESSTQVPGLLPRQGHQEPSPAPGHSRAPSFARIATDWCGEKAGQQESTGNLLRFPHLAIKPFPKAYSFSHSGMCMSLVACRRVEQSKSITPRDLVWRNRREASLVETQ